MIFFVYFIVLSQFYIYILLSYLMVKDIIKKLTKRSCEEAENYPSPNFSYIYSEQDQVIRILAYLTGPQQSVYESGLFRIQIIKEFKNGIHSSPTAKFQTKIYHPNINPDGTLAQIIKQKYPIVTSNIRAIVLNIRIILGQPLIDPMNIDEQIAQQYINRREQFNRIAKQWVQKYAVNIN